MNLVQKIVQLAVMGGRQTNYRGRLARSGTVAEQGFFRHTAQHQEKIDDIGIGAGPTRYPHPRNRGKALCSLPH